MQAQKGKGRSKKGASTIAIILVLAFFVMLPLGLLGYEIARAFLCQQELRNVCDSAALSGSAAMASAPDTETYTQRQTDAMTTAYQTFEFNSILQTPLNTGNVVAHNNPGSPSPATPAVHHAEINLILLDQNGNQVSTGTPAASMTCQAYWTDAPIWGPNGILPIMNQYTISTSSNGGLPQLDIMVCFDVSGSMDDQTPARFVNRYWDISSLPGKLNWNRQVVSGGFPGYPSGGNQSLYDILQLTAAGTYTGTALNVYPPENLSFASYSGSNANGVAFLWSETPNAGAYSYSNLKGLRSNSTVTGFSSATMPEAGMPPGNCCPTSPNTSTIPPDGLPAHNVDPHSQDSQGGFTDLVADMGWNAAGTSGGASQNGFSFNNVETAVEAARGNLESANVLCSAYGYPSDTSLTKKPATLPSPSSGYFAAYWTWVLQNAQPIAQGRQALYNFYNTMNISSNCHLGLISFSSSAGTGPSSVFADTTRNIDNNYSTGGTGTFPNPGIAVNASDSQATDYNAVITAVDGSTTAPPPVWSSTQFPLRPEGATDIADALSSAIGVLTSGTADPNPLNGSARPTAKKAIVLFTDGVPNIPGGQAAAATAASGQAQIAGGSSVNIPIYTIGLATNPALTSYENSLLGAAGAPGIAYYSGNNAIYVPIANASQLDTAFQTIARSLCQLQF